MKIIKNRVGEKHISIQGFEFEIIDYKDALNTTVRFKNGYIVYNVAYTRIRRKSISNPYYKGVYEIGYLGEGDYKSKEDNKVTIVYSTWRGVIRRSYSKISLVKNPTYIGCTVDERWHNFQNFAKWFEENYVEGWELDKDILKKGNKVYSPETCCFVPQEINKLFTKSTKKRGSLPIGVSIKKGSLKYVSQIRIADISYHLGYYITPEEAFQAYKTAKESYIKEIADKWKDLINPRVYEAMYNYQVEITD